MIVWRLGASAAKRLREPAHFERTVFSSFVPAMAPRGYVNEIEGLATVSGYWTLPGPRRAQVGAHEATYGPSQLSAVEDNINSRHMEDYDEELLNAPLEHVVRAGVSCMVLLRERLTSLGESRPFTFRLSVSEYELEPTRWPVFLTFSRYRGPEDDLHLTERPDTPFQAELDAKSFELVVRV